MGKGKPYKLTIEVPGCPENLNAVIRMNRQECNRKKAYWHKVIWALCVDRRPKVPLTKFRVRIVRYSWRLLDYDGLVGSMKPIVDGLKLARIIQDDAWGMTGPWDVSQEFRAKREGQAVVVEIEEKV